MNNEALSQPVGVVTNQLDGAVIVESDQLLPGDNVYSQEYVTALLTALKLEQEQSAYYERHMWNFHGLAESESQRAEAAEQRLELVREQRDNELRTNAELEQRLQQPALADVIAERQRQIIAEGWTPEHDDQHASSEMAGAAACYARHVNARGWVYSHNPSDYQSETESSNWPWDASWWKPTNPRRDLVKAGALILAEIERLDRAAAKVEGE